MALSLLDSLGLNRRVKLFAWFRFVFFFFFFFFPVLFSIYIVIISLGKQEFSYIFVYLVCVTFVSSSWWHGLVPEQINMHIIGIQCLNRKIQFATLFTYLVINLILSMLFSSFVRFECCVRPYLMSWKRLIIKRHSNEQTVEEFSKCYIPGMGGLRRYFFAQYLRHRYHLIGCNYVIGQYAYNCVFFLYNSERPFDRKKKTNGTSSDFLL